MTRELDPYRGNVVPAQTRALVAETHERTGMFVSVGVGPSRLVAKTVSGSFKPRAFKALSRGGTSGFNAVLGGNRFSGQYARLEEHGLYWTASDNDTSSAPMYNFGLGGKALHRQPGGEGNKQMAVSVRCIRD